MNSILDNHKHGNAKFKDCVIGKRIENVAADLMDWLSLANSGENTIILKSDQGEIVGALISAKKAKAYTNRH